MEPQDSDSESIGLVLSAVARLWLAASSDSLGFDPYPHTITTVQRAGAIRDDIALVFQCLERANDIAFDFTTEEEADHEDET